MAGDSFREYVLEQLEELDALRCLAMFGRHGLYRGPDFAEVVEDRDRLVSWARTGEHHQRSH